MEITSDQFATIEHGLPVQRGNVSLSNLQAVNAILCMAEHGCKWRGWLKRFGNWHTIHARMNRRARAAVLDRMFEKVQKAQVVRIWTEAPAMCREGAGGEQPPQLHRWSKKRRAIIVRQRASAAASRASGAWRASNCGWTWPAGLLGSRTCLSRTAIGSRACNAGKSFHSDRHVSRSTSYATAAVRRAHRPRCARPRSAPPGRSAMRAADRG